MFLRIIRSHCCISIKSIIITIAVVVRIITWELSNPLRSICKIYIHIIIIVIAIIFVVVHIINIIGSNRVALLLNEGSFYGDAFVFCLLNVILSIAILSDAHL